MGAVRSLISCSSVTLHNLLSFFFVLFSDKVSVMQHQELDQSSYISFLVDEAVKSEPTNQHSHTQHAHGNKITLHHLLLNLLTCLICLLGH